MAQRRRLLFLTQDQPFLLNSGPKLRESELIRLLVRWVDVELLVAPPGAGSVPSVALATPPPEQIRVTELSESAPPPLARRVHGQMRRLWDNPAVNPVLPIVEQALAERAGTTDLLWVSRLKMAPYVPIARSLGYRVLLDEQNVSASLAEASSQHPLSELWRRLRSSLRDAQTSYLRERYCSACHCVIASSQADALRLHRLVPHSPARVIPNFVDPARYPTLATQPRYNGGAKPGVLLFPGSLDFEPNLRGLRWFGSEVLPRLKRAFGASLPEIVAAGARPSPETLERLRSLGIRVVADPPLMAPLLEEAAIVILPSEGLSVNRMSILEAMASARPVVTTAEGVDGLQVSPTFDVMVADTADGFASAVARLLREPELARSLAERARATIERQHSPEAVQSAVQAALESVTQAQ